MYWCLWLIYTRLDCNEWQAEKRHQCTNMGKVKRLKLLLQLYVTSLPERDIRNIRLLDFCLTECTFFLLSLSRLFVPQSLPKRVLHICLTSALYFIFQNSLCFLRSFSSCLRLPRPSSSRKDHSTKSIYIFAILCAFDCYHRHRACKDHIGKVRQQSHSLLQHTPDSNLQNATTYSRKQSYRAFQHIPDSNHTECYRIFQTAILQNAATYSRHQSKRMLQHSGKQTYRMFQHIPDSTHTECYNVFQTAIIQDATTCSRQQSYRILPHIPERNHTECHNVFHINYAECYNIFQTSVIECYNIFKTAFIQNVTLYSRQHVTDQGSGHNGLCTNTLGGLLNM